MSSHFGRAFVLLSLCGLQPTVVSAEEQRDGAAPIDLSVLTPAVEGQFHVAAGFDFMSMLPPYLAFGQMGNRQKSVQLRSLIARERYDPVRTIADRLIDALGEASYQAVYEPIRRKPSGSMQTLSWSDLPEKPQGELMLDVTIRWICLCSDLAYSTYYPAISMSWRLLDPAQEVVEPTRTLTYYHFPASYRKESPRATPNTGSRPEPEYPVVEVSANCAYKTFKDAEKNPEILWGCFGEAYDAALRRLVIDLKKVHPPRETVIALADIPF